MVYLNADIPNPFEVVVGTYEQYLLGYQVRNIVNEYKMEKSFAMRSHSASVRCVANAKHHLASGGADDSVYLYDMRYRVESGRLMHHNDTVNSIEFTPEGSHIFTCSNDGSIAAIRCGNWQIEKHWQKAHKGSAVNALAIHPTGKLALSTGADGILRTWNLIKGRQVYATNLVPRLRLDAKNVVVLKWSPSGEKYLLAVNQRIDIYSVDMAGIDDEIKFESKIICVEFLKDDLIAVGLENGQIKIYDLEKSAQTVEKLAHDIRVKCIAYKDNLLVTASSSGEIKLWKYSKHKLDMLHTVNCGARITCLTLAMPCKNLAKKKEIKLEDENTIREKKKFRLRQEVVIEDEGEEEEEDKDKRKDDDEGDVGNWEVTNIEIPVIPSLKKKSKKKRLLEETKEVDMPKVKKHKLLSSNPLKKKRTESPITDHSVATDTEKRPKKKKKKLISKENTNNNISTEITEEKVSSSEVKSNTSAKKIKKMNEQNVKENNSFSKKTKNKLPPTDGTEDTPPKKKKKVWTEKNSISLKKKKKK